MTDTLELAARVEAATEPDRELDCEIARALTIVPEGCLIKTYPISASAGVVVDRMNRIVGTIDAPAYTISAQSRKRAAAALRARTEP